MQTLAYEDYTAAKFTRHFALHPDARHPGFFAGLSPFDIPEAVSVLIFPDDRCVFRFTYPNMETPEPEWRIFRADPSLSVRLGVHSRKILELEVKRAIERLSKSVVQMDLSEFQELARKIPVHAVNASLRNAALVQSVLASMPKPFRQQIVETLIQTQMGSQSQPGSRSARL